MQRETDMVKKYKYYKILLIIVTQIVAILMQSKTDINHHTKHSVARSDINPISSFSNSFFTNFSLQMCS